MTNSHRLIVTTAEDVTLAATTVNITPPTGVISLSTATPIRDSNVYCVSVASTATIVRVYYDPALTERNEQTASLNRAVELGYEPPVASTAG
jgi:hypothetical protein